LAGPFQFRDAVPSEIRHTMRRRRRTGPRMDLAETHVNCPVLRSLASILRLAFSQSFNMLMIGTRDRRQGSRKCNHLLADIESSHPSREPGGSHPLGNWASERAEDWVVSRCRWGLQELPSNQIPRAPTLRVSCCVVRNATPSTPRLAFVLSLCNRAVDQTWRDIVLAILRAGDVCMTGYWFAYSR
jgi:hypothetical protein